MSTNLHTKQPGNFDLAARSTPTVSTVIWHRRSSSRAGEAPLRCLPRARELPRQLAIRCSLAPATGLDGRRKRCNRRLSRPSRTPLHGRRDIGRPWFRCCQLRLHGWSCRLGRGTLGARSRTGGAKNDGTASDLDRELITGAETKPLPCGCRQHEPAVILQADIRHAKELRRCREFQLADVLQTPAWHRRMISDYAHRLWQGS
jgi:hypothetical protein